MNEMIITIAIAVIVSTIIGQVLTNLLLVKLLDSKWFVKKCVKFSIMTYKEVINAADQIMELSRDLEIRLNNMK